MRRGTTMAIAVVLAAAAQATGMSGGAAMSVRAQDGVAPCRITTITRAAPARVLLGESSRITLVAESTCPDLVMAQDLIVMVDASGSMLGPHGAPTKAGARSVASDMLRASPATGGVRVGVGMFNSVSEMLCPLGTSLSAMLGCIDRVVATGGSKAELALKEARMEFIRALRVSGAATRTRGVLLLTDAELRDAECEPLKKAAAEMGPGHSTVSIGSVCISPLCGRACLRELVTEPDLFAAVDDVAQIEPVIRDIGRRLADRAGPRRGSQMSIRVWLPEDVAYVEGSARPAASRQADNLTWRYGSAGVPGAAPSGPVTVTFQVRPLRSGSVRATHRALASVVDHHGRPVSAEFDVPELLVLAPGPPVPTARPPRPTPRPTATTPDRPATGRPPGLGHAIHVPIAWPGEVPGR